MTTQSTVTLLNLCKRTIGFLDDPSSADDALSVMSYSTDLDSAISECGRQGFTLEGGDMLSLCLMAAWMLEHPEGGEIDMPAFRAQLVDAIAAAEPVREELLIGDVARVGDLRDGEIIRWSSADPREYGVRHIGQPYSDDYTIVSLRRCGDQLMVGDNEGRWWVTANAGALSEWVLTSRFKN